MRRPPLNRSTRSRRPLLTGPDDMLQVTASTVSRHGDESTNPGSSKPQAARTSVGTS